MPGALTLPAEIVARHGAVLFHQSGGCCDGCLPMCYPVDDFSVGDGDVKPGEIADMPMIIRWRYTELILAVVRGRGGVFSLDNGTGGVFLLRSRLLSEGVA